MRQDFVIRAQQTVGTRNEGGRIAHFADFVGGKRLDPMDPALAAGLLH